MLTETQKTRVRELCRLHKLGMVEFQDNGMVHFKSNYPIKENIQKHLTEFEITHADELPTMDNRPDDMKYAYWVTCRPLFVSDGMIVWS